MSIDDLTNYLKGARNFFKVLLDLKFLIIKEKQGLKSNIYYEAALVVIEVVLIFAGWLLFHKSHTQPLFNLFVASFIVDVAFLILCFIFFVYLYYIFDKLRSNL